ncbi:DEAD/DEAH box helicase [Aquabacterium humicola]|uniref:DEAD/DEAH box helicase n=1 Tax=Aquabacterium humicola TaxID=3237377 RepID=UPI002542A733|nr:DEAD/DEAH box helicase [Rubrivivax pictus]
MPANLPLPFHPAVAGWFLDRFGQPTEVQARAWAVTTQHRHALIAAPTGSGKTLAAFLSAINDLVVEGLATGREGQGTGLADEVHVLYVSPLKALSNDIRKNLQEPLAGIRAALQAQGLPDVPIRDAVRTGDTPQADRDRMRRQPPHILVTTPESLYILLTSAAGRTMLRSVKSVIVDELHAVAGSKRGAHLMLSLERLEALAERPPVRIGLSATVKPLDEMARFLVGARDPGAGGAVEVIDTGHARRRDIALELPRSPLAAVMANEVWDEIYDRLAELIAQHRTTLIFVNQRRVAERAARHLAERLGEEHVTAHHGSLAREHRLQAEQRLKAGALKALVATSSLELGIDIGDVDLVCQLGSPRGINAFLQRVGRAGHAVRAVPKGRLFPLSLDDLLECSALLDAVARGELDRIRTPLAPIDALAQQIVAEVACREWGVQALYECFVRAQPYRRLSRATFDDVVRMLAEAYTTRRGRAGAYLHHDAVNGMLRARRGAQLTAVTNAGVIPDQFDSDVVLLPEEHRVGTLNEDFAFESLAGDVFQLGNTSYRIVKVETGKVFVEDARGQPPSMPFWLGDALGRSDELSQAVARLMENASGWLGDARDESGTVLVDSERCERQLRDELHLPEPAARQLAHYLGAAKAALGVLPGDRRVVIERFFDEVGDTHLVIHAPAGSRINKAWGLALRKRFCRQFNFELQASALEDSIVLSLGPTHSFALDDVKRYLRSASARDVLVQALLDAPMFATRWRWNATAALAVKRMRGARKVPPQFQRSDAQDLLCVVFPDQVACAENITGPREIPDHPLVQQTLHDCLHDTMDVDGFLRLLSRIESGDIEVVTRELTAPSPLSLAVLNARPYAFLDDGAAEERRTKAVRQGGLPDLHSAADIGRLNPEAIAQVRDEARPSIAHADELHDALVVHGFLTADDVRDGGAEAVDVWIEALQAQRRCTWLQAPSGAPLLVAAERLHELQAVLPGAPIRPPITAVGAVPADAGDALRELVRNRLEMLGPVTLAALAAPLGLAPDAVHGALLRLQAEGAVMQGGFTSASADEWCDRRLLARMHRHTRDQRRAEIRPVTAAQFMRFLFRWHQLSGADGRADDIDERPDGEPGLLAALRRLEGFGAPVAAWEDDLLAARVRDYSPAMLDRLCATGRISWWRPVRAVAADSPQEARPKSGPIRATPVLLCEREALVHWQLAAAGESVEGGEGPALSPKAARVLDVLRTQGASFFADLLHDTRLLGTELENALAELVAQGLVSCDSFAGLRALVMPADRRDKLRRRHPGRDPAMDDAGRWSLARRQRAAVDAPGALADPHVEHIARVLLRRYGVVFRMLLEREDGLPPWRDLHYVLRRLEARGEIRGGRFVGGFAGEQFALPEAAAALRALAREPRDAGSASVDGAGDGPGEAAALERVTISAADPLNLVGILVPGEKVPRLPGNRVLFERGVPVAVEVGGDVRYLKPLDAAQQWALKNLLIRRQRPGSLLPPGRLAH